MTCALPQALSAQFGGPWRHAMLLIGCVVVLHSRSASAQLASKKPTSSTLPSTPANAQIEPLDQAQAEQARLQALNQAAPQAYQDKFMALDTDPGPAVVADAAKPPAEPEGFRTWLLESRFGFGESNGTGLGHQRAAEFGRRAEFRRETLNYGEFVLQADSRHLSSGDNLAGGGIGLLGYARESTSGRYSLRNLGFPIGAQTFADTAVGDMYSELTDGLTRNYRLSLGSSAVRGISTHIFDPESDLRAGFGERGYLAGGPYPGFERSQGTLGWLGYTRRLDDTWAVAAQMNRASNIPAYYDNYGYYGLLAPDGFGSKNVTSWATSVSHGRDALHDGDFKLRATVLGSRTDSSIHGLQTGDSRGLFLEGSALAGRLRHEFGAYAARPNLYFGDYALATGTRGAYWRVDHGTSRLSWGGGLDYERAQPDANFSVVGYVRTGANGNFQYLLDRNTSAGGSLNVYQTRYGDGGAYSGDSRSLYGNAFIQTRFFDWPRSRFMLTLQRNETVVLNGSTASGQELQWEQDWIGGRYETMRPELTTTLGYAHDSSDGTAHDYPTAGVQFRYWIDSGFNVTGNLRYTSQSGGLSTSRGLSGTLSAEKDLGQGWRMGFAASLNQARAALRQASLFGPQIYRSNDRSAYVYLRWEGRSGAAYQPVGVRNGSAGGGSVTGRVFFDANRDGEAQVGEAGVANVEVQLDGRYRTLTDRDGRFDFPLATTGRHQLTLTLESVPLPWGAANDGGASVNVPLRGQAAASIAVIRVGD